jgi:hypothetical protein
VIYQGGVVKQIKDAYILRLVERIGDHYRSNISNRFIRPVLLQLSLDKETWARIEDLTEKYDQFRYHGYHLDELYRQLAASARFVSATRREIAPSIRRRLTDTGGAGSDKILRDMAINNFSFNLNLFAELLHELYVKVTEMDTALSKGKRPFFQQVPAFADIGRLLANG